MRQRNGTVAPPQGASKVVKPNVLGVVGITQSAMREFKLEKLTHGDSTTISDGHRAVRDLVAALSTGPRPTSCPWRPWWPVLRLARDTERCE
jgi:hypothetical protein